MLNYFQLLSSILDNQPNRLLISPSENKIVASFGKSTSIKLEDFTNYNNFKSEVLKTLKEKKIGFASISFDISSSSKESIWKEYPSAEFLFPSYSIIFENNKIKEFGSDKHLYKKILDSSPESNYNKKRFINKKQNENNRWINLVEKAKKDISKSKLEKIVVGESKKYSNIKINIKQTLLNMTNEYPDCVTFLYQNKDDYFFGSTPEKVFEYKDKKITTDALAGSIPNYGQNKKEIEKNFNNTTLVEEHKIVVEFLEEQLEKLSNNKISKSKTKIKSLSNINHLLLELETIIENNNFFEFINLLHPSPALAGYPVNEAKEWIKNNEPFNRGLYTGSIGYVENDSSYFFAGLRCAKYSNKYNEIISFAGNGIIENSKIKYEIDELNSKFDAINKSILED
tara:strand:+ start:468 stop:1661 length:1194 start_codon:yes stop_codon:yes gene_type:complete